MQRSPHSQARFVNKQISIDASYRSSSAIDGLKIPDTVSVMKCQQLSIILHDLG